MVFHFFDQFDQFGGGSLRAGFFFDSSENGQVEGFCQVAEAVMEGDQFPAGKIGQLGFAVGLQCLQVGLQNIQVGTENGFLFRINAAETFTNILSHDGSIDGGEPDVVIHLMAVAFVIVVMVMVMVGFFLALRQRNAIGGIDEVSGLVEDVFHKFFQAGAVHDDDFRRFRCFDLIDVQSIIVKAGDAFCDQTGDGDIGALTKPGSELINGQGGGGDLGEGCRCAATGEQCQYQNQREEDGSIFHNDYLHI